MNTRKIRSGLANQGRLFVSALALATVPLGVTPALADITNTATVNGTFNAGNVSDTSVQIDVPVTAATRDLDISKTVETVASLALGTNTSATDGGDTIVYRFTVTNSGNVTETNIDIIENTPTFDGVLGTGSFISAPTEVGGGTGTAASLGPSETVIFEATYELSDADAFRAAAAADPTISVVNTATADSDLYTMPPGDADTAITGVLPVASLVIAKSYTFQFDPDTNSTADVGDEILYSYQITNNGNVPVTAISISDDHENGEAHQEFFDSSGFLGPLGTSPGEWNITIDTADTLGLNSDDAADGSFETLGANGVITFTYAHEVTQEEFDAQ